jgi:hypothetical protein
MKGRRGEKQEDREAGKLEGRTIERLDDREVER